MDNENIPEDDIELLNQVLPEEEEPEEEPEEIIEEEGEASEEEEQGEEESEDLPLKPTFTAVKTAFPELFKKFPELRTAFFKEQEYSKLFPTIEDAKGAVEDIDAFTNLRESALSGNPELLLDTISSTDKDAFSLFSRNFLPSLYKKDPDLYGDTVAQPIQNVLRYAFNEGVSRLGRGDETGSTIQEAAKLIAKIIFGDEGAADGSKNFVKALPKKTEDTEASGKAFDTAVQSVGNDVVKELSIRIKRGLDPNGTMTPFIRKSIVAQTIEEVQKQITHDKTWMSAQAARWARAKREGYDDGSKRKIVNAFLARTAELIPSIRRKIVADALGLKNKESKNRVTEITKRTPAGKVVTSGKAPSGQSRNVPTKVDYSKMSDIDILNS